jgi:hypothetical protein
MMLQFGGRCSIKIADLRKHLENLEKGGLKEIDGVIIGINELPGQLGTEVTVRATTEVTILV